MTLSHVETEMSTGATRVWHNLLRTLLLNGVESNPRGKKTLELLGQHTVVEMNRCVVSNPHRKMSYRFACAEAHWIATGDNRVETIAPYNKNISQFSDDGIFFNGAYGPPFVEQLPYVLRTLKEDRESRQAVMNFWRPRPGASKDIPCTESLQWLLRSDVKSSVLHCVATMRSSDAWLGWPYDVFNFSMLSAIVAKHLQVLGVPVVALGDLFLTAGSQHLYEENWNAAEACVSYPYVRDYDRFYLSNFQRAADVINHLKGFADRDPVVLKNGWLREFFPGYPVQTVWPSDHLTPFVEPGPQPGNIVPLRVSRTSSKETKQ